MKKELLQKLEDLTLCEKCKVSLPKGEGATIRLMMTTKDGNTCSCKYAGDKLYCDECAKMLWGFLKCEVERI